MKLPRNPQGISLLIVLAFIVIVSVLVVGFSESMRLLRPAAASHLERARADQYAWSGVERVIATLNQQTADTDRNWATQPGQLIVGSMTNDSATSVDEKKVLSHVIPLHSGTAAASADPVLAAPNLNVVTYRDPTSHLLTEKTDAGGSAIPMRVAWIYVRKNGDLDTNASPAISTNEIVGRYAYWTDDESSKVNYNIAWGRAGNTNAPGHPTRVELSALTNFSQSYADTLNKFITWTNAPNKPYNFFNTPLDARRIEEQSGGAGVSAALKANKFDVTHFNNDPNTTFFNEPRIVLTTHPSLAGWTYNTSATYPNQWVGVNGLPWTNGGQPRYLRIIKDAPSGYGGLPETADPGKSWQSGNATIDDTRVSETVATIVSYLKRGDWPMVDYTSSPVNGGSIQNKYYNRYNVSLRDSRLVEMGLNIIEYVRAKESTQKIIEPLRGSWSGSAYAMGDSSHDTYYGVSRNLYVTELGLWFGVADKNYPGWTSGAVPDNNLSTIFAGDWMFKLKVELYLPKNYGVDQWDFAASPVTYGYGGPPDARLTSPAVSPAPADVYPNDMIGTKNTQTSAPNWKLDSSNIQIYDAAGTAKPGTILRAGERAVLTLPSLYQRKKFADQPYPAPPPSPAPPVQRYKMTPANPVKIRFSIGAGAGALSWNICPAGLGDSLLLPIDVSGATPEANISTLETDDPRVNTNVLDWKPGTGANTLGRLNSRNTVGSPALALGANESQQDTDSSGNISDASFYMPPPANSVFTRADGTIDDNTKGQVMSVGELGYIHTGVEPCTTVGVGASASPVGVGGIPWRTLRLQPNSLADTKVVPDWAFMDLFTAPVAAPNQYNKYVYAPHDTGFGGRVNLNSKAEPFGLARTLPLAAVLQNCTYDSTDTTRKLSSGTAQTIADNIFVRTLAANGKRYGNTNVYDSPGEVIEVKGIADTGEKSEELVRQIANLVTTRGNVFSVYTIGQAIKQTPSGALNVTAQQRVQSMVERYLDPVTNQVRFSPVYFRNLSP